MRLVTSVANHALGVRHRIHLGKSLGLGGVLFMAAPAEVGHVRQLGNIGNGIVRVFGQGAVAGLAAHARVLPRVMHLGFIGVAEGALACPRIGNRQGGDHVKRTRPVVSILPKVFGHHGGADNEEDDDSRQQDQRGSNQVCRISEKATQCQPPSQAVYLSAFAAR